MVVFGVVEIMRRSDLSRDGTITRLTQRLPVCLFRTTSGSQLLIIVAIDSRAVLSPYIVSLAHPLCGIVALPKLRE